MGTKGGISSGDATRNGIRGGRRVCDILEEAVQFEGSVPLSRMIDLRRELTILIKSELYGGGDKIEGRAASTIGVGGIRPAAGTSRTEIRSRANWRHVDSEDNWRPSVDPKTSMAPT